MRKATAPPATRFQFLDWVRGTFVLLMVEGHTFRALLDPSLKAGAVYQFHELIHNLPGPAFLFASGAAFGFSAFAHWDEYQRWSKKCRQRLLRLLVVLVLGYLLHLTYFSLGRTLFESTASQLSFLLSMNILQCIAYSALLLQFLVMILPGQKWFLPACLAATAAVGLATPVVWAAAQRLPWWLGTQAGGNWGSYFPLFPNAGFAFAGAAWGYLYVSAREKAEESRFLRRTGQVCAALVLGNVAAAFLPVPPLYSDFWHTGPPFFFLRAALLGLMMAGFRLAELRFRARAGTLALLGRESLLVYVGHLMILHGSALNPDTNLVKLFGTARPAMDVALILLLLAGTMTALSFIWSRLKEQDAWRARGMRWSLAGYLVYRFVSG